MGDEGRSWKARSYVTFEGDDDGDGERGRMAPPEQMSPVTSSNNTNSGNANSEQEKEDKLSNLLDVPETVRDLKLPTNSKFKKSSDSNSKSKSGDRKGEMELDAYVSEMSNTNGETTDIIAELEEAASRTDLRKHRKRNTRYTRMMNTLKMNLLDWFFIPDEIPEMGKLTPKMKIQYLLQSRSYFWLSIFLLVMNLLIFSWEFNGQEWGGLASTVLIFQLFVVVLFLVELTLKMWILGVRSFFSNPWNLADTVIVVLSFGSIVFYAIVVVSDALHCCRLYIANVRHVIGLRLITVVQRLSEDDLRFRVNYNASQLDMYGLTIGSHDLRLGQKLGAGAFAEVYLGLYSGTLVAVKVLHDTETENSEAFHREANILTLLRHPNIVLFMGVVDEMDKLWFITEYCAKGSLQGLLRNEALFPPGVVTQLTLKLGTHIARGLAYLHGHRSPILHRDLKTANVLVSMSLEAKVADFGESVIRSKVKKSSPIVGTVQYTAPEVLRAESYAAAADIYSLGVVLWEMAALQLPYQGKNLVHVGYAVGFQNLRPDINKIPTIYQVETSNSSSDPTWVPRDELSQRRTLDLLGRYRRLIQQCWSDEPSERPTAAEALQELEQLLNSTGYITMSIEEDAEDSYQYNMDSGNALDDEGAAGVSPLTP